jgi:hypothetical protein
MIFALVLSSSILASGQMTFAQTQNTNPYASTLKQIPTTIVNGGETTITHVPGSNQNLTQNKDFPNFVKGLFTGSNALFSWIVILIILIIILLLANKRRKKEDKNDKPGK